MKQKFNSQAWRRHKKSKKTKYLRQEKKPHKELNLAIITNKGWLAINHQTHSTCHPGKE